MRVVAGGCGGASGRVVFLTHVALLGWNRYFLAIEDENYFSLCSRDECAWWSSFHDARFKEVG